MKIIKVLESSKFDGRTGTVEYILEGELKKEALVPVKGTGLKVSFEFLNPIQTLFFRFYRKLCEKALLFKVGMSRTA